VILPNSIRNLIDRDNPIILDVGCNDGEHTQMFLNLFPNARVFCFEPDPRAAQRFKARVTNPRAELFEIAIGAWNEDSVPFYQSGGWPSNESKQQLPEGWDFSGSIHKPARHLAMHPWCTFDQTIEIIVRRLDTWAVEHGIETVDFIWADVQGAEGDLVRGASGMLPGTRFLYTEYSDRKLYEGQVTLAQLCVMLPHFEIAHAWSDDVLFRNKELPCSVH